MDGAGDLMLLVLQFLNEQKLMEIAHQLERESGFNTQYLEELVQGGDWDAVEKCLSSFTTVDENMKSIKIFYEIWKQKYLEALDKDDRAKLADMLMKDLKALSTVNEDLYKRLAQLISLRDFSLKWPHLCKNSLEPEIQTLFTDHTFAQQSGASAPNPLTGAMSMPTPSPQLRAQMAFRPFQVNQAALPGCPASLFPSFSSMSHPTISHVPVNSANTGVILRNTSQEHEILVEQSRPIGGIPEAASYPFNAVPVGLSGPSLFSDDLPTNVAMTLSLGSSVTSMDFHPKRPTQLLVGTNIGDISVWELASCAKLSHDSFKVWNIARCSVHSQAMLANKPSISVNKVTWSPNGTLLGVAYSKHLVHLFVYFVSDDLKPSLEIDAHVGGVNDIAFSTRHNQLNIITCGEDKMVKVWDASTGVKRHTFEGHEAPVYSIFPHMKHNVQFIFSTDLDGRIKVWFYNQQRSRVNSNAPCRSSTTLAYSADGSRLFSCGTSEEGETHLVEWDETEGFFRKKYNGLSKRSIGVVQFDIAKNRFLAAGHDYTVKFWDMDNINLLSATDAGGRLPASPRIRFSRDGKFLAISTSDNCVKILASLEGLRLLLELEDRRTEILKFSSEIAEVSAWK